jgi:hypothetical protein
MTPLRNTVAVVRTLRFLRASVRAWIPPKLSQCLPRKSTVLSWCRSTSRVGSPPLAVFMFMILDQVVDQAHRRPDRSPVPRSSRQLADPSVSAAQ